MMKNTNMYVNSFVIYVYKKKCIHIIIYLYYFPGHFLITRVHPPLLSFVKEALLDVGVDILSRVNKWWMQKKHLE